MGGVDPVRNSGEYSRAGNDDDGMLESGESGLSPSIKRAQFAPGGHLPPSRQTRSSEPAEPRDPQPRIRASEGRSSPAPLPYLVGKGYPPPALHHLASVTGGSSALKTLSVLHAKWFGFHPKSVPQLRDAAVMLYNARSGKSHDARSQTLVALVKYHAALTQWGCTNLELLEVAGWFNEDDSSRATALLILHNNRKWLKRKDYQPSDICVLAAGPGFPEIIDALRMHDKPLRDAGFSSSDIAEAAQNKAGARSIAVLAARHRPLIELGYKPPQLAQFAFQYGPEPIDLLARHPQLTEAQGPLEIVRLISIAADRTPAGVLARLQAKIDALPPEPPGDAA